ncbi:MAG: hypothetical protein U9R03_03190, partial [Candidatus Aerophobetes bacterium]|nr:hypothetical protein [Candidatus Aerophobetes bacterium]
IAQKMISLARERKLAPSALISQLKEENISSLVTSFSLLEEDPFKGVDKEKAAFDIIKSLRRNNKQRKIKELRRKIGESEEKGEEPKDEWLKEFDQLKKQILLR